ncbi:MAG: SUMF1/EgtB/PvdO family nonheme iron enzyme [Thiolinea sp.]
MSDIFISYSRHDQEWVGKFAKVLEDAGYSIWWDTRLLAGDEFHDVIPAALEEASCVIVVWSKVSVTRKWVRAEASRAHDKEVLIPIQIESVQIPMPFNLLQAENMQQWNGKRNHPAFQRLLTSIDRYCRTTSKPPNSPPPPPIKTESPRWFRWAGLAVLAIGLGTGIAIFSNPQSPVVTPANENNTPKTTPAQPTQEIPTATERLQLAATHSEATPQSYPTSAISAPSAPLPFEPMVVDIPAGRFTMGCVEGRDDVDGGCDDNEKPPHTVSLPAFKIGKYEVTFAEWDACEQAKACPHAEDEGWGRGKRPVINVSWNDITQKYIPWLNQQTGKRYRLPTETEWEYAARAGGESVYPWGSSISCSYADYWGNDQSCHGEGTSVVGRFAENGFGLHDTLGNVWEWVQDWYGSDYYRSSPASAPQGRSSGTDRVLRGGSWGSTPRYVRSANRISNSPDFRDNLAGFRVAQGQ